MALKLFTLYFYTKQYKGRTDINSRTGPNEVVSLATLLL